jgi:hypothetical protein
MPRTIAGATQTAIDADTGVAVYLIRLQYWDGAVTQEVRLTDAPMDLDVQVDATEGIVTWTGTGLLMSVTAVSEGSDLDIGSVNLTFDGVNQTIISVIMGNQFRNQKAEIYKAWYDSATGAIQGSPITMFIGYQNEPYTIGETSTDDADAVSVSTTVISRVTKTTSENVVLTNMDSHFKYIQRAGLLDTTAEFFYYTPSLIGESITWGGRTLHPNAGSYIPKGPYGTIPGSGAGAGPYRGGPYGTGYG